MTKKAKKGWTIAGIILTAVIVVATWIFNTGKVYGDVKENKKNIELLEPDVQELKIENAGMKADVANIDKRLTSLDKKADQILLKLK